MKPVTFKSLTSLVFLSLLMAACTTQPAVSSNLHYVNPHRSNGFYPALEPGQEETVREIHGFEKRQSVAITLAHSYDDWALAEMAREMGKNDFKTRE